MVLRVCKSHLAMSAKTSHHERFKSKVIVAGDCHEWAGEIASGYGVFYAGGKRYMAHRWSYSNSVGEIPEGMFVCHHCDNSKCVNPEHLFVGTQKDNIRDAMKKGRLKCHGRTISDTHCCNGHEWNSATTYINPKTGHKACRICKESSRK